MNRIMPFLVVFALAGCSPQQQVPREVLAVEESTGDSAKREAYLNQRIRGYVSNKDLESATFRMVSMEYSGGHLQEWEYADGSATYSESSGVPDTPAVTVTIPLDKNQLLLLEDVFNLVVKQELWKQTDLEELAADGGEQTYTFSVGDHSGQFKLINTQPAHLEIFRHKCWKLMESVKRAAKKAKL
ncbi:MAG: hypothetical protein ACO3N7_00130 [Kiritimatiellia bacterium]